MALTTYTLTVQVFKQNGSPATGASVVATLSNYDKTTAKNYVIPTFVQGAVDATGVATLELFPNVDGLRGSYYRMTARDAGVVYFDIQFLMPASNTNFADIDDNYTGFPITSPLSWPDLTALEALGGTGVPVRISEGNWTQTDLGTMATQDADSVSITGGNIGGATVISVAGSTVASGVTVTPVGTLAATDVQAALAELDSEKAPKADPAFTGTVSLGTALSIAYGGTGQTTATAAFDALAPTTTQGDLIYHNGTDNVRLAKGTATQVLTMNAGATAPEWAPPSSGAVTEAYVQAMAIALG